MIVKIDNVSDQALDPYTHLNENQLKHYYEPDGGIFIAESPNAVLRALAAGYEPVSLLLEAKYIETEAAEILAICDRDYPDIRAYVGSLEQLIGITGYNLTRGILAAFRRKNLPTVRRICESARRIAILDNVENPTNVGAIIRSAAALNMDAVLLTKSCADPLYRRAVRVSVGTVFQVPWTFFGADGSHYAPDRLPDRAWPAEGADLLHEMGFKIAALALKEDTLSLEDPKLESEEKLALILGNEGEGLPDGTLEVCDYTVKIPMSHGVDSLNVAAASAVAFWQLGNRCNTGRKV